MAFELIDFHINLHIEQIKAKKIKYYLTLFFLMLGAGLIFGLLSFGGMFELALTFGFVGAAVALSVASFVLAVIYEGEIYWQNIRQAFKKLFLQRDYLKRYMSKKYLDAMCEAEAKTPDCEFLQDYINTKNELKRFAGKTLDKASLIEKTRLKKRLHTLQKIFADQLYSDKPAASPYERTLRAHLAREEQQQLYNTYANRYRFAKIWSLLSAVFMGVLTSYLLLDVLAEITFFSFVMSPPVLASMALISGVAYGFLTFNSITDMINKDTIQTRLTRFRKDWKDRNVWPVTRALLLLALALILTVATAGTWYQITAQTKPLFAWMANIPSFVMGIFNPALVSTLLFDLQNTSETLEAFEAPAEDHEHPEEGVRSRLARLWAEENPLQFFNIPRALLLLIEPLDKLLFMGHLSSMGVQADRFPGVPAPVTSFFGVWGELIPDWHYFYKRKAHPHAPEAACSHDHSNPLPLKMVKFLFIPVYALATMWAYLASQLNAEPRKKLSLQGAWDNISHYHEEKVAATPHITLETTYNGETAVALYRIDRHLQKHYNSQAGNIRGPKQELETLKKTLQTRGNTVSVADCVSRLLATKQGFFGKSERFLNRLVVESGVRVACV